MGYLNDQLQIAQAEIAVLREALETIGSNADAPNPHDPNIVKDYDYMSFAHGGEVAWYEAGKIARAALERADLIHTLTEAPPVPVFDRDEMEQAIKILRSSDPPEMKYD